MVITRKIIVGICIVCAVGTSHSSMAQNRVVTQHTAGTVVEGEQSWKLLEIVRQR